MKKAVLSSALAAGLMAGCMGQSSPVVFPAPGPASESEFTDEFYGSRQWSPGSRARIQGTADHSTGRVTLATPALTDGAIIFRTTGHLIAVSGD